MSDRRDQRRRLTIVLGLVLAYVLAEVVGGLLSGSLALLADAGHMLTDAGALGLSLFALWIAQRPATTERTYGYYRAEVLAALAQGAVLIAIAGWITWEAIGRLLTPAPVAGALMMGVAAGGLLVNLAGLYLLRDVRHGSLNVQGAFLHVMADALGSVGALAAGGLVYAFGFVRADPIASLIIVVLVVRSAGHLLSEATDVLMEGAPPDVDVDDVRDAFRSLEGVEAVHDLHVWSVTTGLRALSAHVEVGPERDRPSLLRELQALCEDRFDIDHITVQIEPEGGIFPETEGPGPV